MRTVESILTSMRGKQPHNPTPRDNMWSIDRLENGLPFSWNDHTSLEAWETFGGLLHSGFRCLIATSAIGNVN